MKTRILILSLVLLAACQPMDMDHDYQSTLVDKSEADSVFTLTLQATKTVDTKALDLVNDGARLNAYWKDTEKVKVFHNGTCVGTLNVSCTGDRPTKATLTGSVQIHGLAVNDVLTLLIPREVFDYTGQRGLLKPSKQESNTLEDTYDYAMATVTVGSISGKKVSTTTDARFENQQSIYRFNFGPSGSLVAREFTIMSANGKLVQSVSYQGDAWTPVFGPITVKTYMQRPDNFYYVALQNGSTNDDTYGFVIVDSNHKLHLANKVIPAEKLGNGNYLSSTNIDAQAATFVPNGETEVDVVY